MKIHDQTENFYTISGTSWELRELPVSSISFRETAGASEELQGSRENYRKVQLIRQIQRTADKLRDPIGGLNNFRLLLGKF